MAFFQKSRRTKILMNSAIRHGFTFVGDLDVTPKAKLEGDDQMEAIAVSKLRENIGMYLKKVEKGEAITITSRGHEAAMLIPAVNKMERSRKTLQQLRKSAVMGDVLSPVAEQWEVMT